MPLLWLGFFALVAVLLVLDLGVIHRKAREPSLASAVGWTVVWMAIGLGFAGAIFVIYENHWRGGAVRLPDRGAGEDAAITYVSAYLLEQALSVDNLFVMAVLFKSFSVPPKRQHRVLYWGILGAIGFRFALLGGGAFIAARLHWIFYVFGSYLVWQGLKLLRQRGDTDAEPAGHKIVRVLRRVVRIAEGDHDGHFSVIVNGRRALTTLAVCLVAVELGDVVFAFDSIPAVLSVSQDTFIMVTSNIFAVLGLRSLYFVLAAAMMQLEYLQIAVGILIVGIGVKMLVHRYYAMPDGLSLAIIAGVLAIGIVASLIGMRRSARKPAT